MMVWLDLLVLRFAADFFTSSVHEATVLLDLLAQDLAASSVLLQCEQNWSKLLLSQNEARSPSQFVLSNEQVIQVEYGAYGHES